MSAPTEALGNLSIGGRMPTRAQTGASIPEERDHSDSESDEENSSSDDDTTAPTGQPSIVRGNSTITYDLRQLPEGSKTRAIVGLTGKFAVDKCRAMRSGFDFDIADHGRVRLAEGPMVCSCRDFKKNNRACRHIFVSLFILLRANLVYNR